MKAIKIFMIMALSSALAGCSDWLSEDGAPKLTYDYYETKEGVIKIVSYITIFSQPIISYSH